MKYLIIVIHTLLTVLLVGCTSGVYAGEKLDGKRHQGIMAYSDGAKYEGEWKDDKKWNGTQTDKKGEITGKWVNGE